MRIQPTAAQQAVLDVIYDYRAKHGYSPSVRDIAEELETSTSVVQYHLNRLEEKGWIERDEGVARSIRLTTGERTPYDTSPDHTNPPRCAPRRTPGPGTEPEPAGSPGAVAGGLPAGEQESEALPV